MVFAIKYSLLFNKLKRVIDKGKSLFHLCFKYDHKLFSFLMRQRR